MRELLLNLCVQQNNKFLAKIQQLGRAFKKFNTLHTSYEFDFESIFRCNLTRSHLRDAENNPLNVNDRVFILYFENIK